MHSAATRSTREEAGRIAASIYRQNRSYLLAMAHSHAACPADAEESIQEALVSFIRRYDPEGPAPALPWLLLTLKRECWRRTRQGHYWQRMMDTDAKRSHEETGAILEAVPAPEPLVEELLVRREEADRRLRPLKPDQRTALALQAAGYSSRRSPASRGGATRR